MQTGGRTTLGMTGTYWYLQDLPFPTAWVFLGHPLIPQALLRCCFLYPGITQNPKGKGQGPQPYPICSLLALRATPDLKQIVARASSQFLD